MDQTRKRHRNMDIFGDIEEAQPYELLAAGVNTRIDEFDAAEKSQVSKKRKKGRRRETESASNVNPEHSIKNFFEAVCSLILSCRKPRRGGPTKR